MIYLLKRLGRTGYDEYSGKVIRASEESEARAIANENTGDEGQLWGDPEQVSCECISAIGGAAVILESFNAA